VRQPPPHPGPRLRGLQREAGPLARRGLCGGCGQARDARRPLQARARGQAVCGGVPGLAPDHEGRAAHNRFCCQACPPTKTGSPRVIEQLKTN